MVKYNRDNLDLRLHRHRGLSHSWYNHISILLRMPSTRLLQEEEGRLQPSSATTRPENWGNLEDQLLAYPIICAA